MQTLIIHQNVHAFLFRSVEVAQTMVSVTMGELIIDARAMPAVDMSLLTMNINMNTALATSVSLVTEVNIESSFRLEQAVSIFMESSDIVEEDSVVLMTALKAQYELGNAFPHDSADF